MATDLSRRLSRLKVPAMLRMRHYKGPYELVNWWEHFLRSIPENAEFADLSSTTQNLIFEWEREVIHHLPVGQDNQNMDLETQSAIYGWKTGADTSSAE